MCMFVKLMCSISSCSNYYLTIYCGVQIMPQLLHFLKVDQLTKLANKPEAAVTDLTTTTTTTEDDLSTTKANNNDDAFVNKTEKVRYLHFVIHLFHYAATYYDSIITVFT